MASSGARRERPVPTIGTAGGRVELLFKCGMFSVRVAEGRGAWVGTILCFAASCEEAMAVVGC